MTPWPARWASPYRAVMVRVGGLILFLVVPSIANLVRLCVQPQPELTVEFAGCDVVRAVPEDPRSARACKLGTASTLDGARLGPPGRRLTLWIKKAPWANVQLRLDGKRVAPLPPASEGGDGPMQVDVYEGASELTVTAEAGRKSTEFRLPILTQEPSREQSQLERARKLRREGDPREAGRLFEELRGSTSAALRARATGQLARTMLGQDGERAIALLYAAMPMDREAGLISDEVADGLVLALTLLDQRHDLEEASLVLDHLDALLVDFPVGRALAPYYRALVASARGDLGSALQLLDASEELAGHLDLAGHLSDVYQEKLLVLALLGRHRETPAVLEKLRSPRLAQASPCARATLASNLGWYAIVAESADDATKAELEEALTLFAAGACDSPRDRRNVLTSLAAWALATGHLAEAASYLERARTEEANPPALNALTWTFVAGRLALASEQPEKARRLFADAGQHARAASVPQLEVAAGFGLAEALEKLGAVDEALAAYAEADDRLNRWSALVPFGGGKQTFFGRHERGVRRYLDLLVRRAEAAPDDPEPARRAACVARRSRARLRAFAEWQHRLAALLSGKRADLDRAVRRYAGGAPWHGAEPALALDGAADEMTGAPAAPACDEPAADEVLLVYHPLPAGWAGFAVTRARTLVARLDLAGGQIDAWQTGVTGTDPADKLLRPFAAVLADESLRRIRFIAADPLARVDLHRLSWKGAGLAGQFSVTYGVDSFRARAPEPHAKTALIVAMSGGEWDLHMTELEAKRVEEALEHGGWKTLRLDGETATRDAVRLLLEREDVGLFHYAGHGFRKGLDGWNSHLSLAHGEQLTLADILGLGRVPGRVILSSCETDAAGDGASVAGLGVAPAFVIAGAEVAVTMLSDPKDALMTRLMSEMYAHHLQRFLDDPAGALHETTTLLQRDPSLEGVDLPPLRVLVR